MRDSTALSVSGLFHAASDVAIATLAGGLALLVLYPLTLCAAGVKGLLGLRARGLHHRAALPAATVVSSAASPRNVPNGSS